jgi:peptidoglycan biosynthesis protein MviN/MurJ (putative lipid II flippase)
MKKTVLTFGLISGIIMISMMLIPLIIGKDFVHGNTGMLIGYSTMVLAGILIFVGVKSYRDNQQNGFITFGRAFKVAVLIALISSLVYVAVWMVLSYTVYEDFMEKYCAAMAEKAKASGLTPEELAAKKAEMEQMKEWYKNPLIRAGFTFLEPMPVGLILSLLSALILKKKEKATV